MSLIEEYLHRNVPEYYPTMHLDGYTPEQIMYACRKKMLKKLEEKDAEIRLEKAAEDAVNKALDKIFKGGL